jgi:hypothetical protein
LEARTISVEGGRFAVPAPGWSAPDAEGDMECVTSRRTKARTLRHRWLCATGPPRSAGQSADPRAAAPLEDGQRYVRDVKRLASVLVMSLCLAWTSAADATPKPTAGRLWSMKHNRWVAYTVKLPAGLSLDSHDGGHNAHPVVIDYMGHRHGEIDPDAPSVRIAVPPSVSASIDDAVQTATMLLVSDGRVVAKTKLEHGYLVTMRGATRWLVYVELVVGEAELACVASAFDRDEPQPPDDHAELEQICLSLQLK